MPIQPRPPTGLAQFLEWVLVQDDARPLKRGPTAPLLTRSGLTGLWVDVAEVGAAQEAVGWRAYAAVELPGELVALLVLTATPAAFPTLRGALHDVAQSVTA